MAIQVGLTRKQGNNLKYRRIYDGYRNLFIREDNRRIVILDQMTVIFRVWHNGDTSWEDNETGEEFEIS